MIDWTATTIALVGVGVAAFAAIQSRNAVKQAEQANRQSKEANENALRIQHGSTETEYLQFVFEVKKESYPVLIAMAPLLAKNVKKRTLAEKKELAHLGKIFRSINQETLNVYEHLCQRYIEGKLDKSSFRDLFHVEIQNLFEHNATKALLSNDSTYTNILRVKEDWSTNMKKD